MEHIQLLCILYMSYVSTRECTKDVEVGLWIMIQTPVVIGVCQELDKWKDHETLVAPRTTCVWIIFLVIYDLEDIH